MGVEVDEGGVSTGGLKGACDGLVMGRWVMHEPWRLAGTGFDERTGHAAQADGVTQQFGGFREERRERTVCQEVNDRQCARRGSVVGIETRS